MVVHEKLSPKKQERDGGLPRHTRKEGGTKEVQVPYTMASGHERMEEVFRADEGARFNYDEAARIQLPTNMRENSEHTVPDVEYGRGYGSGIVLQRRQAQSAVVQRQFIPALFQIDVYVDQIRKLLNSEWREKSIDDLLKHWNTYGYGDMIPDMDLSSAVDIEDEGEKDKRIEKIQKEWNKKGSRLDILMNLCEYFLSETGESKEYEHYLMLAGDINLLNGVLDSSKAELIAAIDGKFLKQDEGARYFSGQSNGRNQSDGMQGKGLVPGTFWIESFVSMQPGTGIQLLREVLISEMEEGSNVALGVYPGLEDYYGGLGFQPMDGFYSGEGAARVMNSEDAGSYVSSILQFQPNTSLDTILHKGLKKYIIYPVYTAGRESVIEKIDNKMKGEAEPSGEASTSHSK